MEKGGKNENGRVASLQNLFIHTKPHGDWEILDQPACISSLISHLPLHHKSLNLELF